MRVKAKTLFDLGLWAEFCEKTGVNPWCINEGQADMNTCFEISVKDADEIGLLNDVLISNKVKDE